MRRRESALLDVTVHPRDRGPWRAAWRPPPAGKNGSLSAPLPGCGALVREARATPLPGIGRHAPSREPGSDGVHRRVTLTDKVLPSHNPLGDQVVHRRAGLEGRIELHERLRTQAPGVEVVVPVVAPGRVPDGEAAPSSKRTAGTRPRPGYGGRSVRSMPQVVHSVGRVSGTRPATMPQKPQKPEWKLKRLAICRGHGCHREAGVGLRGRSGTWRRR